MRKLRNYFLAGLIVVLPSVISFYILLTLFRYFDNLFSHSIAKIPAVGPTLAVVPGIGLLVTVLLIVVIGMFAANMVGRRVVLFWDRLFLRMPVVRNIYNAVKQIVDAFMASGSSAFQKVVLVEYPRPGLYALGFLTGQMPGEALSRTDGHLLAVFIPTTPNPTSGMLIMVPSKDVTFLEMTVDEGLKLIVSGGVFNPMRQT